MIIAMHLTAKRIAGLAFNFALSFCFACVLTYLLVFHVKPWQGYTSVGLFFIWLVVAYALWRLCAAVRTYRSEQAFGPYTAHRFTIRKSSAPQRLCGLTGQGPAKIVVKVRPPRLGKMHIASIPKQRWIELGVAIVGEGIDLQPCVLRIDRQPSEMEGSVLESQWEIDLDQWAVSVEIRFDPDGDRKLEKTALDVTVLASRNAVVS